MLSLTSERVLIAVALGSFLEIRTQTLLLVGLGPSSEEHAMAELRPVRHQSGLTHSCSLLLQGAVRPLFLCRRLACLAFCELRFPVWTKSSYWRCFLRGFFLGENTSRNCFSSRLGNAVHRRQGKRASCREKEALLLLDDQAARVCETSLVPYWPQLRRCLLFRARTQAYLEKG